MTQRRTLQVAARAKNKAAEQVEDAAVEGKETITTAIHIRKDTWNLLRAVAFRRAQKNGGRASVSKLLEELVDRHRTELTNEPN